MNPLHHATVGTAVGPEPRIRTGRWCAPLLAVALAVALAVTSLPVAAQMSGDDVATHAMSAEPLLPYADNADEQTPPILDAINAVSDYPLAHDKGFNNGNWYGDAFAGSSSNYNLGQRIVRLANGDVVVAGVVAAVGATNAHGNNLGLVRYNSAGVRVAWANPGGFGHYDKNYIIYPNTTGADISGVADMVVGGNRIFLLLNRTLSSGARTTQLKSFTLDGVSDAPVDNPLLKNGQENTGAGLVYYQHNLATESPAYKLAVIGTRFENGMGRPVYRRYAVTGYIASADTGVQDIHPAGLGDCSTTIQTGGCIATAVTSVGWISGNWLPPRIYVTGVRTWNLHPDDTDYFVTRIIGGDGTGVGYWDSSFGTGGTRSLAWDVAGNNRDYATAIVAYRTDTNNTSDRVYAVGQVAQTCTPGIGIAAFNHNGTAYTGIGAGGKLLFGGSPGNCGQYIFRGADYANAATVGGYYANSATIVIAGMSTWWPCLIGSCGGVEVNVDPMLAVVSADNGAILEQRDFPVQPGGRIRHGGLYDIINDGGKYVTTGDDRYFNTAPNYPGRQEFVTARFVLDRIFGNGFE